MDVNQVVSGDCLEGLRSLPDGSVDLVFADPPFNIGYEYSDYNDDRAGDEYLDWCGQWIGELHRVLKPDGAFWLAIGDEFAAELKLLSQRDRRFACRNWVVWYYTFGVHCTHKFSRSHVHIFHFVKNSKKFTFDRNAIRVPSARQLVYGDKRGHPKGRTPDDTWILRPQDIPESFASEEDTWYFPRVNGTFKQRAGWHGCQMPEQLLGRIIRVSSQTDELVLDPFAGSGTTLAVAKKLGRRYLGFEISPGYAERVQQRLDSINEGDPLEGAPEPTVSAPKTSDGVRIEDRVASKRTRRKRAAPKSTPLFSDAE